MFQVFIEVNIVWRVWSRAVEVGAEIPGAHGWTTRINIPRSQILDGGEITSDDIEMGMMGTMEISDWWSGLPDVGLSFPTRETERVALPATSLTARRMMAAMRETVVTTLRNLAEVVRATPAADAICYCSDCQPGGDEPEEENPTGAHASRALLSAADQFEGAMQ